MKITAPYKQIQLIKPIKPIKPIKLHEMANKLNINFIVQVPELFRNC